MAKPDSSSAPTPTPVVTAAPVAPVAESSPAIAQPVAETVMQPAPIATPAEMGATAPVAEEGGNQRAEDILAMIRSRQSNK